MILVVKDDDVKGVDPMSKAIIKTSNRISLKPWLGGLLLSALMIAAGGCGLLRNVPLDNRGVKAGRPAPDFTFQDTAGNWVSLSDFRGKKVMLFSWSSWCRCKYQLPALQEFYLQHRSADFEVLAVASEAQGFKWADQYLKNAGVSFPVLVDPNNAFSAAYNFWATENAWLIDEAGIVRLNAITFDIRNPEQQKLLLAAMTLPPVYPAEPPPRETLAVRIERLEKEVAAAPRRLSAWFELADLYRQQGDLPAAKSILERARKRNPLSAEAHWRLGVVRYEQGLGPEAVRQWEWAKRLAPTNYIYLRNLQAYQDPGRFYSELPSCNCGK